MKRASIFVPERNKRPRGGAPVAARHDPAGEVLDVIAPILEDPDAGSLLSFVRLDFESDEGWKQAISRADALIHTASPLPFIQRSDPEEVIRHAVGGTLRALRAAAEAGIRRMVMISSIVAIAYAGWPGARPVYAETDWTDGADSRLIADVRSKTLAERATWDFVGKDGSIALTTVN